MARKMSFVIPEDIKYEDAPELFGRFIEFLRKAQCEIPGQDQFFIPWIERMEQTRDATAAARELVRIYWQPRDYETSIDGLRDARAWVSRKSRMDEAAFLFALIEMAGSRALKEGVSKRMSDAAKSKNANAREWVRAEWRKRADKDQSKASFARQYAPLVKKRFDVDVTPEQISRVWLPKG